MSVQRIYGVEILNSGSGLSVDDIVTEAQYTFVARSLSPMTPINIAQAGMLTDTGMVTWDQVNAMLKNQALQPAQTTLMEYVTAGEGVGVSTAGSSLSNLQTEY